MLSAYQLSVDLGQSTKGYMVSSLEVDSFFYNTATLLKGDTNFLDLYGTWARNIYAGPYYFRIPYCTPYASSFTDCAESFIDNKNLYAMMLPLSCHVATVIPETVFKFNYSNEWAPSDITYSFVLPRKTYVIVMYQYSGRIRNGLTHMVMHLSVDLVPQ